MPKETAYLSVKNLKRYQHYRHRSPPWVKLHNCLLEDVDFCRLPDSQKWLAIGLILLASRTDNRIPADPDWLASKLFMTGKPDLKVLESLGFIECLHGASMLLATCTQVASSEREQSRVEVSTPESSTKTPPSRVRRNGDTTRTKFPPGFLRAWQSYPRGTRSKKAATLKLWRQMDLESQVDAVLATIEAAKLGRDWRPGGYGAPGMQVWLNGRTFDEPLLPVDCPACGELTCICRPKKAQA